MLFFFSSKLFDEKIFNSLFSLNQPHFVKNFAVIAGAKVHPFSACASFLQLFFWSFFRFHPNALENRFLQGKVFFWNLRPKLKKPGSDMQFARFLPYKAPRGMEGWPRSFQKQGGLYKIATVEALTEPLSSANRQKKSRHHKREALVLIKFRTFTTEKILTKTYYIICIYYI